MPARLCRRAIVPLLFLLCCLVSGTPNRAAAPVEPEPALRRPIALVLAEEGRVLLVANQRTGSISSIDTERLVPVAEDNIGRRLSDLACAPDGLHLLALDDESHQLVVLRRQGGGLQVIRRVDVPPYPVSVRVAGDGGSCTVASLWSRRLTQITLKADGDRLEPRVTSTIELPFAPRHHFQIDGSGQAVVADAFGGKFALIDLTKGMIESVRELPAHNLGGIALSADRKQLLVTHQTLNRLARTSFDDVHWGNALTNNLRSLPLVEVRRSYVDLVAASRVHFLGEVGNAAADPTGVAVAADGKIVVALAGIGEISYGREADASWRRAKVGQRPTAVVTHGKRAYVANSFSDSISVVDLEGNKVEAEIKLGTMPALTAVDRGEMLFHDARLTHDGWFSCQSCHTDGHTNGRLNDNLGDGSYGAPKRVLSLLGVGETEPWAWNGSQTDLAAQVRKSILTTMHGTKPSASQVQDLTAYLRTLKPPPSAVALRGNMDQSAVARGQKVFESHSCAACHTPPLYTSRKIYDVGLTDENGLKQFNPPSLRGVGQGGPYFHDGRAESLAEVFVKHRHQLDRELPKEDLADLLAFLVSL